VSEQRTRVELKKIGANIRRERVEVGLTQERLAERADLNIRTLQKIEAGELNILITTVIRIQRALRCPWERLLPFRTPQLVRIALSK
jgi:transcriptional regulator with XRE-family HTH domain